MRHPELLLRSYAVTHGPGPVRLPHHPDWHELVHARAGVVRVQTGTARWSLPPQRAMWLAAGTAVEATVVHRASMQILYLPRSAPLFDESVTIVEVSPLARALVGRVAQLAPLDLVGEGAHWTHVLQAELRVGRAWPPPLPMPHAGIAREVAALLTDDPGRPDSLAVLAAAVGASRRTVERSFRAETGLGAGEWRRRLRLFAALDDLSSGMAVGQVAARAGYSSQSAFGAAFRQVFGVSPRRYVSGDHRP